MQNLHVISYKLYTLKNMYHTDYQAVLLITLKLMKQAVGDIQCY